MTYQELLDFLGNDRGQSTSAREFDGILAYSKDMHLATEDSVPGELSVSQDVHYYRSSPNRGRGCTWSLTDIFWAGRRYAGNA